ncbi:uncharacterized protein [Amphiura filiformis]|uniref:uncharacterized protein n=1 Tax=Amphiura filiformis TaxID=82378 RepID=UPI003B210BF5
MPRQGDQTTYYAINSDIPIPAPKGPLCDEELLKIANALVGTDFRYVGFLLAVPDTRMASIERAFPPKDRTFATLRDWRMRSFKLVRPSQSVAELTAALGAMGREDLANYVVVTFQNAMECA